MEASKLTKLTTCVFVLLNVIMVIDIDAMPGGYRRAHTPSIGSQSCSSIDQYACIQNRRQGNRCISKTQLCDGKCDCPLGEDERVCKFMKPRVTTTSTTTQTSTKTLTSTSTVTPMITIDSTSTCTSLVNCSANSLTTSAYSTIASLESGATVCINTGVANLTVVGWAYVPTTPIVTVPVTKTLICSATTMVP